jgi:glycosyltransferase involved in cell wall biosynthesis
LTDKPLVSVVVEGYNESQELGSSNNTLEALANQDGPVDRVEVILVGTSEQVATWGDVSAIDHPFHSVRTLPLDHAHYYELKNGGADVAQGEIIAFTDSDVVPQRHWLRSIVEGIDGGADVTVGLSLFKSSDGWNHALPSRQCAASITWGWVVGKNGNGSAAGFMDHNVAMRAEVARAHRYRTEFGRVVASPLLYRTVANAGRRVVLRPKQQVIHYHDWRYWLTSLHFRYGFEVYRLRRLDPDYPNQWITRTGPLEGLVTWGWHVLLDVPRWFRYSRGLGLPLRRRIARLPLLVALSVVARGMECLGLYATMIAPKRVERWARSV